MKSILLAPSGKRSKWAVLAFWLVIAVVTLPFAGKLNDVSTDEQNAFLPKSAQSSQLVDAQKQLASGQTFNITAVYKKDSGELTSDEQAKISAARAALLAAYPTTTNAGEVGFFTNNQGAQFRFYIPKQAITKDGMTYADSEVAAIDNIRAIASKDFAGFNVKVTGSGAFDADTKRMSAEINGPLLIGTLIVVAVVLIITYRSPILWILPILVVGIGDGLASFFIYQLANAHHIVLDGLSANIVPVLAFGVGTDYALLLISRYREELRLYEGHHDALRSALSKSATTVLTSATIVVAAMLSLLASDLHSNQALAIVGALSIGFVGIASASLLPALLAICGRRIFWPSITRFGDEEKTSTVWSRIGQRVVRKPGTIALGTSAALLIIAIVGIAQLDPNLKQIDGFRKAPDSVAGYNLLKSFSTGDQNDPLLVVVNTRQVDEVRLALANNPAVQTAVKIDESAPGAYPDCAIDEYQPDKCTDLNGKTEYVVKMSSDPDSDQGHKDIVALRQSLNDIPNADALVGSGGAERMDLALAAKHDRELIIPLMLIAAFIVFAIFLRSVVAPALLIATTLLSYGAALGIGVLVSQYIFGFPAEDSSLVLISFVFLVSLGIDYNVFLAARTREAAFNHDMDRATLEALTTTGSVITSAGAVLAATFAVLATMEIVFVTQLGITVAIGVLLDAVVVRSILVPALFAKFGDATWWPSTMPRRTRKSKWHSPTRRSASASTRSKKRR